MKNVFTFRLVFAQDWILSQRGNDVLPVDWFVAELQKLYSISNVTSRLTECEGQIEVSAENEAALLDQLKELISKEYRIEPNANVFSIEVTECEELLVAEAPADETAAENTSVQAGTASEQEEEVPETASAPSAMERINELVGAAEFKALAAECASIASHLKANNILDSFTSRSYVISINDGFGLSTYLSLFADLLEELGLFEFTSRTRVVEVALGAPDAKQGMDNAFTSALANFQNRSSGGKIVCIDISEWMTQLSDKQFRDFLHRIDEHIGENIVVFRVPFVERNIIKDIVSGINDILFVKDMSIPPFNSEELRHCANNIITDKGFTMDDAAWEVFNARIVVEKSDGRFYGINTIRKIIYEMLYNKQLHNIENNVTDKLIMRDEISSLVDNECINTKDGYEQLSELIGMDGILDKVKEVVAQIEASIQNDALDTPCIHMRFVGNPGTGKTTVARIIGTILKEKGILRNGSFFEISGRDLCGRFVGETAPKTAAICRDAYGSVLFIDEAYSLYRDDGFSHVDYGKEAIDTLVAEMENHRTDLMVIMAGYTEDMDKLMNGNIGLKSRMPYLIEFPNYTREQLAEIFMSMVDKGFDYDDSFSNAVHSYFESLADEILNAKDFSNARFVRNLFERTWGKAALRCQMSQIPCKTLTVEDLALATSDKEFHNIMEQKKKTTLGFH